MATSRSDWLRWDVARGIGIRRGAHRLYGRGFVAPVHAFPFRGSRLGRIRLGSRTVRDPGLSRGHLGVGGEGLQVRIRLRGVADAVSVAGGVGRVPADMSMRCTRRVT